MTLTGPARIAESVAAGDRLAVALREALRRLGEEAQSRVPWAEDALMAWSELAVKDFAHSHVRQSGGSGDGAK